MEDYKREVEHLRNIIAEKMLNGELQEEGFVALDRKLRRIYDIGYAIGRYEGERMNS